MLCTNTIAHRSAFVCTNADTHGSTNNVTDTADIFAYPKPHNGTVWCTIPCAHCDADSTNRFAHTCALA